MMWQRLRATIGSIQGIVSLLGIVAAALGSAHIFTAEENSAVNGLIIAVLGMVTAFKHDTVATTVSDHIEEHDVR